MAAPENPQKAELLRAGQYYWARIRHLGRLPGNWRHARKIRSIGEENRESWGSMLEETAGKYPDNPAVKSHDGSLTYKAFNELTNRYANYLIDLGLRKGAGVSIMVENRPDLLALYSAVAKIGAVNIMINTNLRQEALIHCLTLNRARIFVVGEEVIEAFDEVREDLSLRSNQQVFYLADSRQKPIPKGYTDLKAAAQGYPVGNPPTTRGVGPGDVIANVFTSGTTGGMPKAAVIRHGRLVRGKYFNGRIVLHLKPDDTFYVPLPFFHTNALALSWPCVFAAGSAIAIRRKFSASNFLSDVRQFDATLWCYIGELCRYLLNQPEKPDDHENPLKKIMGNGLKPDIWKKFKKRFGVSEVYEMYGAAESNLYFVNRFNLENTVGTTTAVYSIVAYDVETDQPVRNSDGFMEQVKKGGTGLLLGEISDENPFPGYTAPDETEAKVLRDVFQKGDAWFNTGDLVCDIGYRHIRFVDRTGDTFRWKGENVSTTEVEKVAGGFPGIALVSAYGVRMPGGEGRAGMIAVIPEGDAESFDPAGLAEWFAEALPSYAVPRFLRIRADLEATATHKIKKFAMKEEGFDPERIKDPLFVLLPGKDDYEPLTKEIFADITEGKYRF
jgi:citronellyl-CoA synthetase